MSLLDSTVNAAVMDEFLREMRMRVDSGLSRKKKYVILELSDAVEPEIVKRVVLALSTENRKLCTCKLRNA